MPETERMNRTTNCWLNTAEAQAISFFQRRWIEMAVISGGPVTLWNNLGKLYTRVVSF